jgi:hypothetical protein
MTQQEQKQYERVVEQNRQLQQELRGWQDKYKKLLDATREQRLISGLFDNHNTPICDGDILKETYPSDEGIRTDYTLVQWHQPSASFVMVHSEDDYTHFDDYDVVLDRFEVVGNKETTPELLNKIEGYKDANI